MRQTFSKKERLYRSRQIELLFAEGKSFFTYPFKVVVLKNQANTDQPVELLISVSKRNFKRAVDRNRVKRLVREAFRKNKEILINGLCNGDKTLLLGLIYTPKTIIKYKEIERKIILILQRLIKEDAETAG